MTFWVTNLFKSRARRKQERHDKAVQSYRTMGWLIGSALSQRVHDHRVLIFPEGGFGIQEPELYHLLNERELAYAELGYRVIPLQDWIDYGGWNVPIAPLWLVQREEDERPVFTKFSDVPELPERNTLID